MKRTDIAMIILIASVSVMVTYFSVNALVGDTKDEAVKVKTAEPISAEIEEPDPRVFNSEAINPTVEVIIGGTNNQSSDEQSEDVN